MCLKCKDSKLVVRKLHDHSIEFEYGAKMTPSYPLKEVSKSKKRKGHWSEGEFEFDIIQMSPKGFQKAIVSMSYDPDELSHEDHEMMAEVFEQLSRSHKKSSKRV